MSYIELPVLSGGGAGFTTDGQGLLLDGSNVLSLVLNGTSLAKSALGLKFNDASPQFIDVSSSTTAFRVTQRGTGAALLVEDSTNPDSTPFVIDSNGNVGIGTLNPQSKLVVQEPTSGGWSGRIVAGGTTNVFLLGEFNSNAWLGAHNAGLTAWAPFYINPDGPQILHLGAINSSRSNGTIITVANNPLDYNVGIKTNSTTPSLLITQQGTGHCLVVEDSTNPDSTPFVIDTDGRVGIGTSTPSQKLDVIGSIQASQEVQAGTGVRTLSIFNTNSFVNAQINFNVTGTVIQRDVADANPALIVRHANAGSTGDILRLGNSASTVVTVRNSGNVGINSTSPTSALHLGQVASSAEAATCLLDEKDTTPASPTSGTQVKMYMKADKIIFQYNDGGTVRYKYLDLTGTTDTWTATTTAP